MRIHLCDCHFDVHLLGLGPELYCNSRYLDLANFGWPVLFIYLFLLPKMHLLVQSMFCQAEL